MGIGGVDDDQQGEARVDDWKSSWGGLDWGWETDGRDYTRQR